MRRVRATQGTVPAPSGNQKQPDSLLQTVVWVPAPCRNQKQPVSLLQFVVWVPAFVWIPQPLFIPWVIWPVSLLSVATPMTSDCFSEGDTIYPSGNRCPKSQGGRLSSPHSYPSIVEQLRCFRPENVRPDSGKFAPLPLLINISLDN